MPLIIYIAIWFNLCASFLTLIAAFGKEIKKQAAIIQTIMALQQIALMIYFLTI